MISDEPIKFWIDYLIAPEPGDQVLLLYVGPYYTDNLNAIVTSGPTRHLIDISMHVKPVYLSLFERPAISFDLNSLLYFKIWWGTYPFWLQIGDNQTFTQPVLVVNQTICEI